MKNFATLYYAGTDAQELAGRTPANLAGAANAHLAFARRYAGGGAKLRAYNPSLERDGWESPHTVLEIVNEDMPFLVDSVGMEVNRHGLAIHLLVHPVLHVNRDASHDLVSVDAPGASAPGRLESFIHLEVDRQSDARAMAALEAGVANVLRDVRAAVEDWRAMQARMRSLAKRMAEGDEGRAFLEWLLDHHFTFLGSREYEGGRAIEGTGLGLLREKQAAPLPPNPAALVLAKSDLRSTVHRPGYLDYVGVKRFDGEALVGETCFVGLYTHTAYAQDPFQVPVLRRTLAAVVQRAALLPESHSGKALASILETYPRDELLQIGEDELYAQAMAILRLGERPRLRLLVRRDAFGRYVSCLIFVPRERYNTELRQRFQRILADAFDAASSEFDVSLSVEPLARILMRLHARPGKPLPAPDVAALEERLAHAMRRWRDALHEELLARHGEEAGNALFQRYADAFPVAYREENGVQDALEDIGRLQMLRGDELAARLYVVPGAAPGALRLKLYRRGARLALSDSLPLLEHLGLHVQDERPYRVAPASAPPAWILAFDVSFPAPAGFSLERVREPFHQALLGMARGTVEPDRLNSLVLAAGLDAREIAVLRAYARYLRQGSSAFSLPYIEAALTAHPDVAALLVRLFVARFDPARADRADADPLARQILTALDGIESLDEDRILRSLLACLQATTRTNYFGDRPCLAFKLDSRQVPALPEPRPMFEIWVYSPRVEAVHLRGGHVARGGIRWSDRREDFRTEVLGLMKAQMVKNAVIVPVGAKGGFVVKRPPKDRQALAEEGIACYRLFLRGLLDLTDNIVQGRVVPPSGIARYDGDDPYLVVAADKGTAGFSDIANALAVEAGYWLGDAFASGGATGYNHKSMGITARGAWESVKRHFRALGIDPDTRDFTVVGIGDMSGDVFGNGMLQSRHIRLVAAFDHRHIFLDPAPDAAASYAERERLFRLPASSWADYDRSLISPGGGVFPRSAKSIPVSPQCREALGIEADALSPPDLIRAILCAPVDLLYNGGIGTYVKARRESNAEIGDRANDAVRVDGADLRSKVVVEGGNLGFTQHGRIEYALHGGRINTDAIDNSAGVDCSDHEVNIKILLDAPVRAGTLSVNERNDLLAAMTEEVAGLVLRDNYLQNQCLSLTDTVAPVLLDEDERLVRSLEKRGRLNRGLEALPDDEGFVERRAAKRGLTRPEQAVLLAYAKIALYEELLASDVADDPHVAEALTTYFPSALRERFAASMTEHPLRREIIATRVANGVVNRMGATFVARMQEQTGASAPEVVRAYLVACAIFAMEAHWQAIEELDGRVAEPLQIAMLIDAGRLIARATLWFLRQGPRLPGMGLAIERFSAGAARLEPLLPELLPPAERAAFDAARARLAREGVPQAMAQRTAALDAVFSILDIVQAANTLGRDAGEVARLYFALAAELRFPWLRARIATLAVDTHWQALAKAALRDDLGSLLRDLTIDALRLPEAARADPAGMLAAWKKRNAPLLRRFEQIVADLQGAEAPDFAMLSVAMRELRNLSAQERLE